MEKSDRYHYNAIDLMKFTSSILVISIHTNPFSSYSSISNSILVQLIARLAVPFFFTVSGYLFFLRLTHPIQNENNWKLFTNYLFRLLKLYIFWSAIYFILVVYSWISTDSFNLQNIIYYVKKCIFVGTYAHLWYFPALISAVILVYVLLHFLTITKITIISCLVYIIGTFGLTYYNLVKNIPYASNIYNAYLSIFHTTRNGFFFGFIFVSLGAYIAYKNSKLNKNFCITAFLLSIVVLSFEFIMVKIFNTAKSYYISMYIFMIPVIFYAFNFLINAELKDNNLYVWLRKSSILIYCIHFLFTEMIFSNFLGFLGLSNLFSNSFLKFILVTIFSAFLAFMILFLSRYKAFKWLKIAF